MKAGNLRVRHPRAWPEDPCRDVCRV